MSIINWDTVYKVEISVFDDHHKVLVDLINSLYDILNSSIDFNAIERIFKELVDYTMYHFKAEEAFLEKHNYPGITLHKKNHVKFVQSLEKSYKDLKSTGYLLASIELFNFLKEWLLTHILVTDKEYSDFFKKLGIS